MSARTELAYFRDIIIACDRVAQRVAGRTRADFDADDVIQNAIIYRLAVIGEAVSHMSAETVAQYPDIPWSRIKSFRNFVIHEYFAVNVESVWDTASVEAPKLRNQIAAILAAEYPEEQP